MEIQIKVEDYLTPQRIAEICEEVIYDAVRGYMRNEDNFQRIVTNGAYFIVRKCIDSQLADNKETFEKIIQDGVRKVVESGIRSYDVFRYEDPWRTKNNIGAEMLDQAIRDNKGNIEAAVEAIIKDYPFDEVRSGITDACYEVLERRLFGKGGEADGKTD